MRFTSLIAMFGAALLALGCCADISTPGKLYACGGWDVVLIDAEQSTADSAAIVWSLNSCELKEQLGDERVLRLSSISECKNYGTRLLLCSSSLTVLLDTTGKKVLFSAITPMAHSAELLPDGRLAVALSDCPDGNRIEMFDLSREDTPVWSDSLFCAHGVVKSGNYLYAIGRDELRCYRLGETPSLSASYQLPCRGGHDLSPYKKNKLILSTHEAIYLFDTKKKRFELFSPIPDVKSINASGIIIYTRPSSDEYWWCDQINYGDRIINIDPDMGLYKARPTK